MVQNHTLCYSWLAINQYVRAVMLWRYMEQVGRFGRVGEIMIVGHLCWYNLPKLLRIYSHKIVGDKPCHGTCWIHALCWPLGLQLCKAVSNPEYGLLPIYTLRFLAVNGCYFAKRWWLVNFDTYIPRDCVIASTSLVKGSSKCRVRRV